MSAGMIAPIPRWTTSPGTSAVTSISPGLPSRTTTARCVTRECKASAARSARYSLLNPSPTLTSRITPMTIAFVASPRNSESPAVMSRRIRMGLANCRPSTDHPLAMWVRTAFGPISVRRLPASAPVSPFSPEPSSSNTAATGRPAARAIASGAEGESLTSSSGMRNPFTTFRLRHSLCPGRTVQEPLGPGPCGACVSRMYILSRYGFAASRWIVLRSGRCRIRHLPRWEAPPGRLDLSETAQQTSGQRVNRKFNKPAAA